MVTPVLIATHEYEWAIHIFAALFARYWGGEQVVYFGDRQEDELPANVEFRRVPAYAEGIWPWRWWFGNGLRSICEALEGQLMALFLPDHWLNRPVDTSIVARLADYMDHRPALVRANLTDDQAWGRAELVEFWRGVGVVEIKPWDIHHGLNGGLTFCPSLWRPELLARLIEPHWTLWECERLGTERVKVAYPNIQAVGSLPAALSRTHGLGQGRPNVACLAGLNDEDRAVVLDYLPEGWRIE
jgi:hypothetical protein